MFFAKTGSNLVLYFNHESGMRVGVDVIVKII